MWTMILLFALISPQHPELAIGQTLVGKEHFADEAKCLEKAATFMNNMRTGIEKQHGKGSLLITGNCFSGWSAGPDGEVLPPESQLPNVEQKNFR